MSLLMDALKKAELAKRQAGKDRPAAPASPLELTPLEPSAEAEPAAAAMPFADEPAVEPAPGASPPSESGSLPDLPQSLELLDQEFIAEASELKQRLPETHPEPALEVQQPAPVATPAPAEPALPPPAPRRPRASPVAESQGERAAAQNLFEAKKPGPGKRNAMIAGALFGFMGLLAIGIYFWLQLQPKSPLAGRTLATASSSAGQLRSLPPPATEQPAQEPAAAPASTAAEAPIAAENPVQAEAEPPAPAPARVAAPRIDDPAPGLFRITRTAPKLDPAIDRGYRALQRDDLAAAKTAYEQALKDDPRNADALHGLASVQMRQGHPEQAEELYLRAIESNPKDALAQASLISLNSRTDPIQSESRLKLLLAAQPESSFLHFYLGNLYARQNRWAEAQESYYRAMSGDPANPDYLFNLAVSLDQLHQGRAATQYYEKALQAAATRPAGFDRQQVSARLARLQQP